MRTLPARGAPAADAPARGGDDHPMRVVTRAVAADDAAWSPQVAQQVTDTFDRLAEEWHTRWRADRLEGLADAFERGWPEGPRGRVCVELGSGTGFSTPWLARAFPVVVAVDLSAEMLARAPADAGHRLRADAARLPLRAGEADAVVLVNALLFPGEVERVLAPAGRVVWVNTSGESTPIHLPAQDVEAALPGAWDGVASRAGAATWAVLWRAGAGEGHP